MCSHRLWTARWNCCAIRVFDEQAYSERLEKLFQKFPSVQKVGFAKDSYKPGLEGMSRFGEVLGKPWENYRCVHVAGTNGKGSVCSMIASSLASEGLRVGLFTSPHLVDFRERIKLVGPGAGFAMIAKQDVWDFLQIFDSELEGLSFFEITTGMALWWFARQNVDYAVVEVGLGGRLDSTNVIEPELSVVTSIGLDHCALLGATRAAIASEKGGIFKRGVPALVGFSDPETLPVFREIADRLPCPLTVLQQASVAEGESYQKLNRATAFKALEMLGHKPNPEAVDSMEDNTGLHGRWERVLESPEVIADIGHNPAALALNFARLESLGRPLAIVFGIMADKDLDSIVPLMPAEARYFLCAPAISRALPVGSLENRIRALRPELELTVCASVVDALARAVAYASSEMDPRPLIYLGGSNFVVAEALQKMDYLK